VFVKVTVFVLTPVGLAPTPELYKLAIVHLYIQGVRDDDLVNFELSLTSPSIIFEQEKINVWKEKVDLAKNIIESKILPTDWVYDNIFHLSEDQYDEYRDLVKEDVKRGFRWKQIENEGNDPLESGKSYGTPHDLASLYGRGRYQDNSSIPPDYDEKTMLGRPTEKSTDINTQDNAFGKDRLGKKSMKIDDQPDFNSKFKGGSPLALENKLKHRTLLESLEKTMVFNKNEKKKGLLDESQIKE
jgi:hypothetical protein